MVEVVSGLAAVFAMDHETFEPKGFIWLRIAERRCWNLKGGART